MSLEFTQIAAPQAFPSMCICGSQTGPLVDTYIEKQAYGRIYLCRLCVKRSARALGLVKGAELERLEQAADQLDQMQREVDERQALIETMTVNAAERDKKIAAQEAFIGSLQADASQRKHLAELIASNARELTAA